MRREKLAAQRTRPLTENLSYDVVENKFELEQLVQKFIEKSSENETFILEKRWLEELGYHTICKLGERRGFSISLSDVGNTLFKKRRELVAFLKENGYIIDKRVKQQEELLQKMKSVVSD